MSQLRVISGRMLGVPVLEREKSEIASLGVS